MSSNIKTRDFAPTSERAPKRPFRLPPRSPLPEPSQHTYPNAKDRPPRPITDCEIVFALDISQSTRGRILAEECALIENFANGLTSGARDRLRVLPWDEIQHPSITVKDFPNLSPAGRTDPSVLLRNQEQVKLLQNCHLWFLFTDGEIVPQLVRRFALGIASRSLHGTACVIVVFGSRPAKPILCNISVGFAVFGVSPDSLFVFHDAYTHEAYILQCKGCFNVLMPHRTRELNLDKDTDWTALPRLNYPDLLNIKVRPPAKLAVTDFQLQSGRKLTFDDLYAGRLTREIENELLSNGDDLKSAILTATSRGQGENIHRWIASHRGNTAAIVDAPRPDVNGDAARLVRQAIKSMRDDPNNYKPDPRLRRAHSANLSALKASIEPHVKAVTQVAENAMHRLALIEIEGPSSPGALSAISPGGAGPQRQSVNSQPSAQLIYTKGYRFRERAGEVPHLKRCNLCGDRVLHLALILKKPLHGEETPSFPRPFSFSGILFPLAIGNYRETDIISTFTCCDACSYFAMDYGTTPFNESITGALLFGPGLSLDDEINKGTWLNALQIALEGRFNRESAFIGSLAIVCNALDRAQADLPKFHATIPALHLARSTIQTDARMSYEIGDHTWTGSIEDVVDYYISKGTTSPDCEFLDHPIESSVLMIRNSQAGQAGQAGAVSLFHRLLLHFIEHAFVVAGTQEETVAMIFHNNLRTRLVDQDRPEKLKAVSKFPQVSMRSLLENCMVNKDAVAALKPAAWEVWNIERSYGATMNMCLYLFNTVNTGRSGPRQIFNWFLERPELKYLFANPDSTDQALFNAAWDALA